MPAHCGISHELKRLSGNQPKPVGFTRVVYVNHWYMRRMNPPCSLNFRTVDAVETPNEA